MCVFINVFNSKNFEFKIIIWMTFNISLKKKNWTWMTSTSWFPPISRGKGKLTRTIFTETELGGETSSDIFSFRFPKFVFSFRFPRFFNPTHFRSISWQLTDAVKTAKAKNKILNIFFLKKKKESFLTLVQNVKLRLKENVTPIRQDKSIDLFFLIFISNLRLL